ncbi:hypothetical protein [Mycolicibacterium sp. S2-37]|uniref:hypothetical protein n=1 Tax=Mycolicibacterium sp. S2-37 TaxID=2810297 RepID=UPI001A942413|nr:hypothetical protein [Mycolicibacterium sp. S2-37]
MEVTPEEAALAKVLRDAAKDYGRLSWDSWLYRAQAKAVIAAGYQAPRPQRQPTKQCIGCLVDAEPHTCGFNLVAPVPERWR